ncbi:MAG: hypothetical protein QXX55_00195 [Candidatus Pacearchaeota archaeon]
MREDSQRKKIIEYFQKNLKKGYTLESLKWALIGQGYSRTAVELAIQELNKELAKRAPILKEEPIIKHEIIDENNNPIKIKKSWWQKIFRL